MDAHAWRHYGHLVKSAITYTMDDGRRRIPDQTAPLRRVHECYASTSRSEVRGITPIVRNPGRWPRPAMKLSGPITFDGLVGIGTTVKDQYPGISG